MTKQQALDRVDVGLACGRGYVVVTSLDSSAHLYWLDLCREQGLPYLAVFPREPTLEVDLRFCAPDLDAVRAVYRQHRVRPDCASAGVFHHYVRRRRAEPLARDLWAALTRKE